MKRRDVHDEDQRRGFGSHWRLAGTVAALLVGGIAGMATAPDSRAALEPVDKYLLRSVSLDQEFSLRFRRPVPRRDIDFGTIRIRSGGNQAKGALVHGRPMIDSESNRRVTVRPEAVREYFQLVRHLDYETALRKSERLLARIERTGRLGKLDAIDRGLRDALDPSSGAGTRLDRGDVTAFYPPTLEPQDELSDYRQLVAGDDALWQTYLDGNLDVFEQLRQTPRFERFFHPRDLATGFPVPRSLLRQREHRRVLILRNRRFVTFIPHIPHHADANDTAYEPGETYTLTTKRPLPRARSITLAPFGGPFAMPRRGIEFTTVSLQPWSPFPFAGVDDRAGRRPPRVVNVTPPNGEIDVDATTDWEDPDNQFELPLSARKRIVVRLRFAAPLDPRTVHPGNVLITKTKVHVGTEEEEDVFWPVEAGVFLEQSRLGEVRVDVTPRRNLDPGCEYDVRVTDRVRSLNGSFLSLDFRSTFTTR